MPESLIRPMSAADCRAYAFLVPPPHLYQLRRNWRTRMTKIRHLAIKTKDPERLAKFYEEVFGMKCIHAEKSGARYMSDGYLTLAILRNRGEATPSGINHF